MAAGFGVEADGVTDGVVEERSDRGVVETRCVVDNRLVDVSTPAVAPH